MPAKEDSSSTAVPSPYNPENLKCSSTGYMETSVSISIVSDALSGKCVQKVHCMGWSDLGYKKKKKYKIIHVVRGEKLYDFILKSYFDS